jgi:type IV pilus assembly protein PilW
MFPDSLPLINMINKALMTFHRYTFLHISGFTLVETVIAMVISLIIVTSIYQIYHVQHKSHLIQQQVSEMQQRLRGAVDLLVNDIQMAGYDPTYTSDAAIVTDFPEPNDIFEDDIDYAIDKEIIAFTIDDNGDGVIQTTDSEQIAYRLRNNRLERYKAADGTWEAIVTGIDALNFVYFDAAGNVTNTLANIRTVELTLLARSTAPDYRYVDTATYQNGQGDEIFVPAANDHYRRRLLITRVQCRNLGL